MKPRTAVARARRSSLAGIARSLRQERGHVRPAEVRAAAAAVGLKASQADVAAVLARLGMYRH